MSDVLKIERDLLIFYEEVSQTFGQFQKSSQLPCLSGCGQCCLNPELEVSMLEMLPMALKLEREGRALEIVDLYESKSPKSCMMYQSHSQDGSKGLCSEYQTRPFICRAFAVAGLHGKENATTYSVCKILKQEHPIPYQSLLTNKPDQPPPYLQDWSIRLSHIHPEMLQKKLPISTALYEALLKVLTFKSFEDQSKLGQN